jgi:hypothetical protein
VNPGVSEDLESLREESPVNEEIRPVVPGRHDLEERRRLRRTEAEGQRVARPEEGDGVRQRETLRRHTTSICNFLTSPTPSRYEDRCQR